MAFSAQTDHGQCEQKDAVLCRIGKETSKEKAKVCSNSVNFSVALIRVLCAIYVCKTWGEEIELFVFGAVLDRDIGNLMFKFCLILVFCGKALT